MKLGSRNRGNLAAGAVDLIAIATSSDGGVRAVPAAANAVNGTGTVSDAPDQTNLRF
jgi:hypothetical protein